MTAVLATSTFASTTRPTTASRAAGERPFGDNVTLIETPPARNAPAAPFGPLSRVRGGTYSSTVGVIRFSDGSSARTDLIRLTPNVDAYSLNADGVSPRQLSHYREAPWRMAPLRTVVWQDEITRVLANSYPFLSLAEVTQRLRAAGYPIGAAELREHEAIAATQAAVWRFTNGLELDTARVDRPVAARGRIGAHPSARPLTADDQGRLAWSSPVPAGETVYLEVTFAGRPQLQAYQATLTSRTARHDFSLALEASSDGWEWQPISSSRRGLSYPEQRQVRRRLGLAATIADAHASAGDRGYRHYRLAVTGPHDHDSLIEVSDLRFDIAGPATFRNADRVVYLYDYLLDAASGQRSGLRPQHTPRHDSTVVGPFTLTEATATVQAAGAEVVDRDGHRIPRAITAGQTFYLRHTGPAPRTTRLEVQQRPVHAHMLIGARSAGGPGEYTLLVTLSQSATTSISHHDLLLPA